MLTTHPIQCQGQEGVEAIPPLPLVPAWHVVIALLFSSTHFHWGGITYGKAFFLVCPAVNPVLYVPFFLRLFCASSLIVCPQLLFI
jgi:hypothetical protein